jgi:hypothetical protein
MWIVLKWSWDNVVCGVIGPFASLAEADAFCATQPGATCSTEEMEPPHQAMLQEAQEARTWGTQAWAETHGDDLGESPDY